MGSFFDTSLNSGLWHCAQCDNLPARIGTGSGNCGIGEFKSNRLKVISPRSMASFAADSPIGRQGRSLIAGRPRDRRMARQTTVDIINAEALSQEVFTGGTLRQLTRGHIPRRSVSIVRQPEFSGPTRLIVTHECQAPITRAERVIDKSAIGLAMDLRFELDLAGRSPDRVADIFLSRVMKRMIGYMQVLELGSSLERQSVQARLLGFVDRVMARGAACRPDKEGWLGRQGMLFAVSSALLKRVRRLGHYAGLQV